MASIGKTILKERPFAAVVSQDYFERKICFSCFLAVGSLKACTKCQMAFYCGAECQRRDWTSGQHWAECSVFQSLSEPDRETAKVFLQGRLVARIYGRKTKAGERAGSGEYEFLEGLSAKPRELSDLLSLREEWAEKEPHASTWASFRLLFRQLYGKRPPFLGMPDGDLAEIYGIVCTNDFNVTGYQTYALQLNFGLALYLQVSRFDHSCQPDLDISFQGCEIVVKLAKSVEVSRVDVDKLSISYYPGFNASLTEQRRRLLSKHYLFRCECPLCSDTLANTVKHYAAKKKCPECEKTLIVFGDRYACLHCQHKVPTETEEEMRNLVEIREFLATPGKFVFEGQPKLTKEAVEWMRKAEKVLDPVENVLLLQTRERLACSLGEPFSSLVPKFPKNVPFAYNPAAPPFGSNASEVVELYERILASYKHYNVKSIQHAVFASVLGRLYELREEAGKAKLWLKKAKVLWTYFTRPDSPMAEEMDRMIYKLPD